MGWEILEIADNARTIVDGARLVGSIRADGAKQKWNVEILWSPDDIKRECDTFDEAERFVRKVEARLNKYSADQMDALAEQHEALAKVHDYLALGAILDIVYEHHTELAERLHAEAKRLREDAAKAREAAAAYKVLLP